MSYNGHINFGLLADYDAVADVEDIAAGIERSLEVLGKEAKARSKPAAKSKAAR